MIRRPDTEGSRNCNRDNEHPIHGGGGKERADEDGQQTGYAGERSGVTAKFGHRILQCVKATR